MPEPEEITKHHDWDPPEGESVFVDGGPAAGPVDVVPYDPAWPELFAVVTERVRDALGKRVVDLTHVGSTAVPGLPAKPIIDADLTVANSADEDAYVPALETTGFRLVIRERGWHEHRMLTTDNPRTNLHVFSPGCPEAIRHRLFRDWLREHPDDLARYREVKLAAASDSTAAGEHVMDYNQRKQPVIREIYDRIFHAHRLL